jgi:hypothetical protein
MGYWACAVSFFGAEAPKTGYFDRWIGMMCVVGLALGLLLLGDPASLFVLVLPGIVNLCFVLSLGLELLA